MENIRRSDIDYMCKHETKYMELGSKNICEKYLTDKIITDELLKVYAEKEIETLGDMAEGVIEFRYENKIVRGKYHKGDYPAKILGIYNAK